MTTSTLPFATVEEAIEEVRAGRMVVVCDSEERENEGDLVLAAQFATPEAVNFMARHGRGLICLALTEERCEQLGLLPMVRRNESAHGTAFTAAIEAREGITTGISAPDRSRTIMVAIDPNAGPQDLVMPGQLDALRCRAVEHVDGTAILHHFVDIDRHQSVERMTDIHSPREPPAFFGGKQKRPRPTGGGEDTAPQRLGRYPGCGDYALAPAVCGVTERTKIAASRQTVDRRAVGPDPRHGRRARACAGHRADRAPDRPDGAIRRSP